MEKNHNILKYALAKMPEYVPDENIWPTLLERMAEQPLKEALAEMPQYEPDEQLWELISRKPFTRKNSVMWWYAAAVVLVGLAGVGLFKNSDARNIAYSQEKADERLQADETLLTDEKYERLKAYCETETLVCGSKDYKRLQQEYEKLNAAAEQLQQAIGAYNTEPELVRQFSAVEEQKAEVLNEMAKMI